MNLENQFAVVLFDRITTKRRIYLEWFKQIAPAGPETSIIGNQLGTSTDMEANDMIIIECGSSTLHRMMNLPHNCKFLNCTNPDSLFKLIKMIMEEPIHEISGSRLNTIVIENLSSFYWEKRSKDIQTSAKWYKELNELLTLSKDYFKCNVVVTMWDLDFERGFKLRQSKVAASNRTLSFTPDELFLGASYSLSYQEDIVLQYLDGSWQTV